MEEKEKKCWWLFSFLLAMPVFILVWQVDILSEIILKTDIATWHYITGGTRSSKSDNPAESGWKQNDFTLKTLLLMEIWKTTFWTSSFFCQRWIWYSFYDNGQRYLMMQIWAEIQERLQQTTLNKNTQNELNKQRIFITTHQLFGCFKM